ncbi:rCG59617, partial [Rattus norvegicus]
MLLCLYFILSSSPSPQIKTLVRR